MGLRPLYAGTIHGSAPFIRRDDTRVCALYTQGLYIRVCALHTQGCWPGIIYSGLCPYTQGFGQGLYLYIYMYIHIYVCGYMMCLSYTRVVPILDVLTCSQDTRPVTACLLVM